MHIPLWLWYSMLTLVAWGVVGILQKLSTNYISAESSLIWLVVGFLHRDAGIQMQFCVPGFMQHAEIEDVVALVAPTPLLLSAATDDPWSRGAQRVFQAALPAFANSTLQLRLWPGGHAFTQPMREAAYQFLAEHLHPGVEIRCG